MKVELHISQLDEVINRLTALEQAVAKSINQTTMPAAAEPEQAGPSVPAPATAAATKATGKRQGKAKTAPPVEVEDPAQGQVTAGPGKPRKAATKAEATTKAEAKESTGNGAASREISFDELAEVVKAHAAKVGVAKVRAALQDQGAGRLSDLDAPGRVALLDALGL